MTWIIKSWYDNNKSKHTETRAYFMEYVYVKVYLFDLRLPGGVPFDPGAFIAPIEVQG